MSVYSVADSTLYEGVGDLLDSSLAQLVVGVIGADVCDACSLDDTEIVGVGFYGSGDVLCRGLTSFLFCSVL